MPNLTLRSECSIHKTAFFDSDGACQALYKRTLARVQNAADAVQPRYRVVRRKHDKQVLAATIRFKPAWVSASALASGRRSDGIVGGVVKNYTSVDGYSGMHSAPHVSSGVVQGVDSHGAARNPATRPGLLVSCNCPPSLRTHVQDYLLRNSFYSTMESGNVHTLLAQVPHPWPLQDALVTWLFHVTMS